jgi:hypothetical protein
VVWLDERSQAKCALSALVPVLLVPSSSIRSVANYQERGIVIEGSLVLHKEQSPQSGAIMELQRNHPQTGVNRHACFSPLRAGHLIEGLDVPILWCRAEQVSVPSERGI